MDTLRGLSKTFPLSSRNR